MTFRPNDAIECISLYRNAGIEILGVDGFYITPTTTQPDQSLAFIPPNDSGGWDESIAFIRNHVGLAERLAQNTPGIDVRFEISTNA